MASVGGCSIVGQGELTSAVRAIRPQLLRAFVFALVAGTLVLSATIYMLEVYERVINSGSTMTLAMLTLMVLFSFAIMELLQWARSETLREAGLVVDEALAPRIYEAMHA